MAVVAVDGGDELRSVAACEKQRRGGRSEESERGSQGLRGDARRVEEEAGGGQGRARARATHLCPSGKGGRRQGGEAAVGWAVLGRLVAPGKWLEELGQVGFSLSFF